MIPETTGKQIGMVADERVAKVFVVMGDDMRKCLICEQVFSREEFLRALQASAIRPPLARTEPPKT